VAPGASERVAGVPSLMVRVAGVPSLMVRVAGVPSLMVRVAGVLGARCAGRPRRQADQAERRSPLSSASADTALLRTRHGGHTGPPRREETRERASPPFLCGAAPPTGAGVVDRPGRTRHASFQ